MKYHAYELAHAMVSPFRMASQGLRFQLDFPFNPLSGSPASRSMSAACSVFERLTGRYGKPEWGIEETVVDGVTVPITIETVKSKSFCNLIHFKRDRDLTDDENDLDMVSLRARQEDVKIESLAILGRSIHETYSNSRIELAVTRQTAKAMMNGLMSTHVTEIFSPERDAQVCREF